MTDNNSYDTLPESEQTIKRFRCGDTREDGKMFWAYNKTSAGGEYWVSPEQFARRKAATRRYMFKHLADPERRENFKRGQRRRRALNLDKIREQENRLRRKKRAENPVFAMSCRMRRALAHAISARKIDKSNTSASTVGLSWKDFTDYIGSRFLPGMTWDNRAEWEIDHIVPQACAKTEQDVIDLNHYLNLRPLWKQDNLLKSDSMPPRELVPDHLLRFIDPSS